MGHRFDRWNVDKEARSPSSFISFKWHSVGEKSGIYVYSCGAPLSVKLSEFEDTLDNLLYDASEQSSKVVA